MLTCAKFGEIYCAILRLELILDFTFIVLSYRKKRSVLSARGLRRILIIVTKLLFRAYLEIQEKKITIKQQSTIIKMKRISHWNVKTVYHAYRGIRIMSEWRTHGILRIRVTFCVKLEQSALTYNRARSNNLVRQRAFESAYLSSVEIRRPPSHRHLVPPSGSLSVHRTKTVYSPVLLLSFIA